MRIALPSAHKIVSKGRHRPRALAAALLMVLPTISIAAQTDAEATAPVVRAEQAAPTSLVADGEASAMALAYRTRDPVLVNSLTSETTRTWAMPEGTFKAEIHQAPVRTRNAAGDWVDVDLTLQQQSDGSVAPKAHARGLWLSGARSAESQALAVLGRDGEQVSLGWRGALPEPVLNGSLATYPDVLSGVDLLIQVGRTGFEFSFVVENAQAAQLLSTIEMPWDTGSLSSTLLAGNETPPENDPAVVVSDALMWDARVSASGEPVHQAEVAVSTTPNAEGGTDLVLTPDSAFYTDPNLTYPVTIDPDVDLYPAYDAFVQNTYSTDRSGTTDLRLGYSDDAGEGCTSGCTARSFLSFHSLSGYSGAMVISAELFLWNFHSWSCTAFGWESWKTSYVNATATWTNQPTWLELDGTSTGTKGYSSGCADGWVSISVAKTFQGTFSAGSATANVGLRATSETNHNGWKKFNSSEASSNVPRVELSYNRTPNVPTHQTIDSCYIACSSPATVRSGSPTIKAKVSDPDSGTLRIEFEVFDNAKATLKAKSGTAVTGVTSGSDRGWRIVPLSGDTLPDATYHWRARACDSYICGGYSGWFTFTVDTSPVGLPTVSSDTYLEKTTGTWNGGAGTAGTFSFGPNDVTDVTEYIYSLNGGDTVRIPAGALQGEMLTANQQNVTTDLTGFVAGANSNLFHSSLGHDAAGSVRVNPNASGDTAGSQGDTFAAIGGDMYALRLGMQPGKRYWITGWIYVPATTGLNPTGTYGADRGLRLVAFHRTGTGAYVATTSDMATVTESWQMLSLSFSIPAGATEAFIRLYNGMSTGSNKQVYWDDLSLQEVTGTTSTQSISPTQDGMNRLAVNARNSVGNTSDPKIYDFLVRPSQNSWVWTLDESAGSTTAASAPDNTWPAVASGGVTFGADAAVGTRSVALDGTGKLAPASPVLDTSHAAGFTVAAWAQLTDKDGVRTAVSQGGTNNAMFQLGFRDDRDVDNDGQLDEAWCFIITASDTVGATTTAACTTNYVAIGDWVSLVGIFDKPNGRIVLYVNGTNGTMVELPYSASWSATEQFAIGCGRPDPLADGWFGQLDHVYAVQGAWPPSKVQSFHKAFVGLG